MRHRVAGRTLGRKTNHRIAMWRNMAVSLFTHEQITTTLPKAKSVQPFVEKLITAARKGDLASRRRVIAQLGGDRIMVWDEDDEELIRSRKQPNRPGGYQGKLLGGPKIVKHLFDEIGPRYTDRQGGYTRIIKLAQHRIGDGADLCVLQLVGEEEGPQVSGQYSRRREKANRRMQRAAELRRGGNTSSQPADESETTEQTSATATAAAAVAETDAPEHDFTGQQPDTSETVEGARDHAVPPGDESGGPIPDETAGESNTNTDTDADADAQK